MDSGRTICRNGRRGYVRCNEPFWEGPVTARIAASLLLPLLVVLFGTFPAAGQEPAPGSRVAVLEAPLALRLDHKSLREALNRALEDKAGVGDAAL